MPRSWLLSVIHSMSLCTSSCCFVLYPQRRLFTQSLTAKHDIILKKDLVLMTFVLAKYVIHYVPKHALANCQFLRHVLDRNEPKVDTYIAYNTNL